MNIFYGSDNILVSESVNKFIYSQMETNKYLEPCIYYLDQIAINEQFIQILNEIATKSIFNLNKIIIINDYFNILKTNHVLTNDFIKQLSNIKSNNLIVIKLISDDINLPILEKIATLNHVKIYNKKELKSWIKTKATNYELILNEIEIETIMSTYPRNLSVLDNELKKLKNLRSKITIANIKKNGSKYFNPNIYQLVDYLLVQNYEKFWWEYRKYWQNINYDVYNIFNLLLLRIELIRNIRILQMTNNHDADIMQKLDISFLQYKNLLHNKFSIEKVNQLLILANDVNLKIKNGKTNKNIAIELFFLKI